MAVKARTKAGKVYAGYYLSPELYKAVKQRALDNGTSASDEVQAALERHLAPTPTKLRVVNAPAN